MGTFANWRRCWTDVDYGQIVIPQMPCPRDRDNRGYHLCRRRLGHRGAHECGCEFTWNPEKV